jgi:altronate dehydratase
LVAAVALELIRHHGSINLAETVELVGAEDYLLKNVRDRKTALKFLSFVEDFKERMAWHGHSPEGNPSGGNRYRGLYNIVIKSLGAAMKRHPEVCLDYAIDYSERMENPGFYFMNSPGNDLESIAGQVASGVNLIFFTTGSGSVTNFPFVPTLKVLSTTSRYNLLPNDIDVNAGLLFEGIEMEKLVEDMFELTIRTASGAQCLGEKSGHHQVSIWRNWFQRSSYGTTQIVQLPELDRKPLLSSKSDTPQSDTIYFTGLRHENCLTTDQIGLVLPTSLCSSHVARRIASHLNEKILNKQELLSSFLSLDHTEGCGVSEGSSQDLLVETLIGYLTHPRVRFALLIEHGCEKVHNNLVKQELIKRHLDPSRFGWMSIQLDGGVEAVAKRVEDWFLDRVTSGQRAARVSCGLGDMRLAMLTEEAVVEQASVLIPKIAKQIVEAGGTVVVPGSDRVLESDYFWKSLDLAPSRPTIPYGSRILDPGLYLMDTPTRHWVELLTGLGASGAETIVALAAKEPRQGHPLIPTLQVGFRSQLMNTDAQNNFDLVIPGNELEDSRLLLERIALVMSREYVPKAMKLGNTDFQMTRGFFGVSV